MKKILLALVIIGCLVSILPVDVWAAGSCVKSGEENITVIRNVSYRKIITLTCTGDGSITAYDLVPEDNGVQGWYLYSVSTNPDNTSAPTADYDITLVVDGEDVAGGKLLNRSETATETVAIAPTTQGYAMMGGNDTADTMEITFANNTANPSIIVMKLRFTTD